MRLSGFISFASICLVAGLVTAASPASGSDLVEGKWNVTTFVGGKWNGPTSFVEGTVEISEVKTSGEGELLNFSTFEVTRNRIYGIWDHHDESGGIEIRMTKDGPHAEFFAGYVYGYQSSVKQVGRDLYVEFYVNHELGGTDLAFTLKGVFAENAPIVRTAQPKPVSQKDTPQLQGSKTVEERLAKLKELLKKGLLTPDEAAAKRKEILNSL